MPMNLDAVGAVSSPDRTRGRRRTRCCTRSASARARPTRPASSSSSRPRTRKNVDAARAADDARRHRDGRRSGPAELGRLRLPHAVARRAGRDRARPDPARRRGRHGRRGSSASTTRARPRSCASRTRRRTSTAASPRSRHALRRVHPRRGRLRRDRAATRSPTRRRCPTREARPRGDVRDARRPGVALPALRRPQPAALRPGDREVRGLRQADPARPLHVRLHRPGVAARAVRLRRREVQEHGRALLEAGHARATRSPCRCGTTAPGTAIFQTVNQDGVVVIDGGRFDVPT